MKMTEGRALALIFLGVAVLGISGSYFSRYWMRTVPPIPC